MKRIKMKRKVIAVALSLAMVMTATLSLSVTVLADRVPSSDTLYSDYGQYLPDTRSATQDFVDGADTNKLKVPVQARVVGEGDIVYNVSIVAGEMKFEYNYGSTWDPATHKYVPTPGTTGEGWTLSYLEGTQGGNNNIHVINGSNFPVVASFEYEDNGSFGDAPVGKYNVGGIFSTANATLVSTVTANNTDPAVSPYRTANLPLEMYIDTNEVDPGTTYYYKTYDNVQGKNEGDMYFALLGTPARNLQSTLGDFTEVGTITVTITPDSLVTSATT